MPSQARVRWDLVFQGLGASGPHLNRASCTELSQTMPLGPSPLPAGPHPPGRQRSHSERCSFSSESIPVEHR